MRNVQLSFSALILISISPLVVAAQQAQGAAPAPPQRDPQALTILGQCLSVSGGQAAVAAIQDFSGKGTITYNWANQPVSGSVMISGKGLAQFRMDTSISGATKGFIVNGSAGNSIDENGGVTRLPFYSVMTAGSLTLPANRLIASFIDPSVSLKYVGLVSWDGSQVYQIHVAPRPSWLSNLAASFSKVGEFDFYVDSTSYQVRGLSETIWPVTHPTQGYLHEIVFSNYTSTNGLSVPFGITEKIEGQQTWSIALTSLTFNSGVADSSFRLQ